MEACGPSLFPFVGNERQDRPKGIAFALQDFLELVDWTGRAIRQDKRGHIPSHLAPNSGATRLQPRPMAGCSGGFQR
jgi:hypothetical protein